MDLMIEAAGLTKRYGRFLAIEDVSFEARRGEILGLLGPNGAGKTTTMRILAGFMPATAGTARVAGMDITRGAIEARRRIGYLPENVPLYPEMRVIEYLKFRASLKGLRGRRRAARLDDVVSVCGLEDAAGRLIARLSKGYRQRVGLAESLVHEPELLILDEPTIGLDPNQIRQIRDVIKRLGGRQTVLLSTHILSEVEMICGRVMIMNGGRIIATDSPENLLGLLKGNRRYVVEARGPEEQILRTVAAIPGVLRVHCDGEGEWRRFTVESERERDVREPIFAAMAANQWTMRELRWDRRNLEDVFVAMTQQGGEP